MEPVGQARQQAQQDAEHAAGNGSASASGEMGNGHSAHAKPGSSRPVAAGATTLPSRPSRSPGAALDSVAADEDTAIPLVAPGADLARVAVPWQRTALCFALTFAVYLLFVPRLVLYSSPPTGDQVYYMLDTISLVQDHDLLLNNNYARQDWQKFYRLAPHPPDFVGMSAPQPLPPMLANSTARPPDEQYSFHLPSLAVWLIPAWVVGGAFQLWWPACVVFMCLLGALLALNVFLFAHELTGRAWIAWMVWLPVAFAAPVMSFSLLIFTELPVGLLMIYAFRRLALGWGANGPWRLFLVGLAIGNIPWLAWRCLPIAGALALYALVQWWRYRRVREDATAHTLNGGSVKWLGLCAAPAFVLGGLLLFYNAYLFGSVMPDSSVLEQGRVAIFHFPWQSPEDARLFVSAIFGLLFDRGFGLLPYAPIYVLVLVGMLAAFRLGGAYKRLLLWMGLVSLPYLFVICAFDSWNGVWSPPARYLTTFVPFLAGLLAVSLLVLASSLYYKILYFVLAVPGWILMAVTLSDPHVLWPIMQGAPYHKLTDYPNSPIKIDLSLFLPIFSPVDDAAHPVNTAWITILAVGVVVAGYLLMQYGRGGGLRAAGLPWLPYTSQGALWALTLLVIGSGWFFMNHEYLKHRTTLVEVRRWELDPPIQEAFGISYLDGKIYIAVYNRDTQGFVGVFDPATGRYAPIEPQSPDGAGFDHVGDVKPSAGGLFYVLNNGDGNRAVYVMTPQGRIVKEFQLPEKTPIATGLYVGPNGHLFIADMLGGHILEYGPEGGQPLGIYGGVSEGFNNPSGVAVTPDGMIYVAEQSAARIQQLDPSGKFVRKYDLRCNPSGIAVSGDFLDISCDSGLIGVNWKTQEVQLVRYDAPDHRPNAPTGLTYGPDNTLYALSEGSIIEYRVEH